MRKIAILSLCLFAGATQWMNAQDRVITTGVPFLMIAADARAAGMGDIGVSSSTDAYSQQYNPAKYAFALTKQGFSVSYTPILLPLLMIFR